MSFPLECDVDFFLQLHFPTLFFIVNLMKGDWQDNNTRSLLTASNTTRIPF